MGGRPAIFGTAAIAMTIIALAIPPFAAIVANAGREGGGPDQGSDEPPSR
jgi:hypothetical protein